MQAKKPLKSPALQILTWNVEHLTMKAPENLTFTDCRVDWACLKRWAGYTERWLQHRHDHGFRFVFLQELVSTPESLQLLHDICSKWHMAPYTMSVGRFHVCILVNAVMVTWLHRPTTPSVGRNTNSSW